jgi:hypothetical protein
MNSFSSGSTSFSYAWLRAWGSEIISRVVVILLEDFGGSREMVHRIGLVLMFGVHNGTMPYHSLS